MYVCYIDEAGCTGELSGPASAVQPAFVLNGLIVPAGRIESLTRAWIQIKQAYFPNRLPPGSILESLKCRSSGIVITIQGYNSPTSSAPRSCSLLQCSGVRLVC